MRKLMWFTVGFGAACGFCAHFWATEGLLLAALIFAALFGVFLIAGRWAKWLRVVAAISLGCTVGLGWFGVYSAHYLNLAAQMDGKIADVTARCTDYGYQTGYGTAVEGILYLEGKPFRAKFYVSGEIDMEPGDVLTGVFRLRVTTPDGADEATAHQGKGIFLLAYQVEDAELAKLSETPGWAYPALLRHRLTGIINACIPTDAAGFAKALLLGDRTGIDYETNTAFKISGISHVIAVSGLHVSILFTMICMLCFKNRWLVALLGIPALVFFAAMAGFSPSVVRACIMMILMILAMLLNRDYDGPSELAAACLVMFMCNPLVITSVSFQLSVGCMIGIFMFQKRLSDWMMEKLKGKGRLMRFKRWFAGSVSMTLSAMSLTTPLVAYYFGTISLVGILTNLLTLWIILYIFCGVMMVCLTGWFWPGIGAIAGSVIAWPIRYVLVTAKVLSRVPLAAVYTESIYIVLWLVFCYILLAVFLLSRKKRPGTLLCCAALSLCLCVGVSWLEPLTDECRMTVLDVGQGQCILLQSEGKTYMVDCGGSDDEEAADRAAERLLSMGVFRLDGVVLTHFDADHAGGLPYLLTRIPADMLFVPDTDSAPDWLRWDAVPVFDNLELSYGHTKLTIFGPVVQDSDNESSLAVLFQSKNCDILITGDRSGFGERMLLKSAEIPRLEVLVAGHHGAKSSTCEQLLAATKPRLAVISVGENHYGHPSPEVLNRLTAIGCTVYRTDRDGDIIFRR